MSLALMLEDVFPMSLALTSEEVLASCLTAEGRVDVLLLGVELGVDLLVDNAASALLRLKVNPFIRG